jgi:hypothetical protein
MRKAESRKLVFVRWLDASFQAAECTDDELNPGIIVESAGILAREDDESISLALDSYPQQGIWRRIQHIPKPFILEVRRVNVPIFSSSRLSRAVKDLTQPRS